MKVETIRSNTIEVFTEGQGITITCTQWSNSEGVNVMVLGADGVFRSSMALRWEELDVILVALTSVRSA